MDIQSIGFLISIAGILIGYFLLEKTPFQKYVIPVVNMAMLGYATGWVGLLCSLLVCTTVFFCAKGITHFESKRKIFWRLGVFSLFGVLIYFKYFNLFDGIIAPIGLAYFSLTLYTYLYDVYHKKLEAENNFLLFFGISTFFPTLFQGPINIYKKVKSQFETSHKYDWDRMVSGLQRMLWGSLKKIVIADRIGIIVNGILADSNSKGVLIVFAMALFGFQMYADFSGGIDFIMGISEIMGIEIKENFNAPIFSKSVTEFWARWHMSLGEFMEKYVYYPIALNKKVIKFSGKIPNKQIKRTFSAATASTVVFILVGIWHGTGWNYVVYGCYHAVFVAGAVIMAPLYKKIKEAICLNQDCISWKIFCILRTFCIMTFSWFFAKTGDLSRSFELIKQAAHIRNVYQLFDGSLLNFGLNEINIVIMFIGIIILILVDYYHIKGVRFRQVLMRQDIVFRYFVYFVALFSIIIFGIYGGEFSKASFIYQEF